MVSTCLAIELAHSKHCTKGASSDCCSSSIVGARLAGEVCLLPDRQYGRGGSFAFTHIP